MRPPPKTLADYIVVAISPLLIMLLVGSLAFFWIQVFYRGAMVQGIRWVMFWFVLAIVLISRIGIEQGKGYARFYGAALAVVTWLYLAHTQGTMVLGALLLAISWWCAHQLTLDCTLIREDEDGSGEGVLQGLWGRLEATISRPPPLPPLPKLSPLDAMVVASLAKRRARKPPRPPGRSVVWFSLAALPLFGTGQLFLPANDSHARNVGFVFLVLYLGAALSLLATTSFLGLRRYLRQRFTEMPASVTLAWLKSALFLATGALLLALILPRPGANYTWKELAYRIEPNPHQANDYAFPFNPPGQGDGRAGNVPAESEQRGADSKTTASGNGPGNRRPDMRHPSDPRSPPDTFAQSDGGSARSGSQGSSRNQGRDGPPGNNAGSDKAQGTTPERSVNLKDVTGPASADDSRDGTLPASPDNSVEQNRDGRGNRKINAEPSRDRPETKNVQRREPRKEQKALATQDKQQEPEQPANSTPSERRPSQLLARLLRVLVLVVIAALLIGFLVRYRKVVAEMIRAFLKAVREFFQKLFALRWRRKPRAPMITTVPAPALEPFAAYENPFLTGKDKTWSPDRLLCYTYEAVCAWGKEQSIAIRPQETPREFCVRLLERFPDLGEDLEQFSFYYTHVAFAGRLPDDFEAEPIRRLWRGLGDAIPMVAAR